MASPESTRKNQVRLLIVASDCPRTKEAIIHEKIRTTVVRIAVAVLELTSSTPTFARTAVAPANNAESNAHINQVMNLSHSPMGLAPNRY